MSTKEKSNTSDPFYSMAEAAEYLGQRPRWLKGQLEKGTIQHAKMGRLVRFRKSWLDAYIEEHTVTPESGS